MSLLMTSLHLTDDLAQDHLLQVSHAMIHGINTVFPPLEVTGHNGGEPISENKLAKHDGLWDQIKEILGWIKDIANFTICMPPKKGDKIVATLKSLCKIKKLKIIEFQKITGTLHHAATGIQVGQGLFKTIWAAMENCKKIGSPSPPPYIKF